MKISRYLQNVINNFPVGHFLTVLAMQHLDAALEAEKRSDFYALVAIAEKFGISPDRFSSRTDAEE